MKHTLTFCSTDISFLSMEPKRTMSKDFPSLAAAEKWAASEGLAYYTLTSTRHLHVVH